MNRKIFASAIAVLTGIFVYSSCTKVDSTDLGNDLIPVVDNVNTFETVLDVVTDNFLYPDSTAYNAGDLAALGLIGNDPEFGSTSADIYVGLKSAVYGTHPFLNKDSVTVDSVVLSLAYSTAYGDTNSVQTVEVTQLSNATGNFQDTTLYKLNHAPFATTGGVRGTKTYTIRDLNDSVFYVNNGVDTVRTINQLRIKMDPAFATQLVNFDTTNAYKNDSAFTRDFRGLAIKMSAASPTKNGLAYFNLLGDGTRLTVYARVTVKGQVDTISPYFPVYDQQTANLIKKTPGGNYLAYLNNNNPDDDKVYITSAPGSYATVQIKGLDTFKTVNRVIHRAELIIEKIPSQLEETYTPVPTMFVNAVNATGDSSFTLRTDFSYTGSGPNYYDLANLGGTYISSRTSYVFNLSRYMQGGVTKGLPLYKTLRIYAPYYTQPYLETPTGTKLVMPRIYVNEPLAFGRVVVGGGSHPTKKMRVRIIYSKI